MQENDYKRFGTLVQAMCENTKQEMISQRLLKLWFHELREFPIEVVVESGRELMHSCPFRPTLADKKTAY